MLIVYIILWFFRRFSDIFSDVFPTFVFLTFVPSDVCRFWRLLLLTFVVSDVCRFWRLSVLTFVVLTFVVSDVCRSDVCRCTWFFCDYYFWAISRDFLRGPQLFWTLNCPLLRSGQFKGSKKSLPPQKVPWNSSKIIVPPKNHYVPHFLKQRDIGNFMSFCNHLSSIL